jgi:hypothetical protein
MGESLSFHPFVDLLRHWAVVSEDDAEADTVQKLEVAVRAVAGVEADEIFPFIATLMGLRLTGAYAERIRGIDGDALEKVVLKSMRDLMRAIAAARPLVLVFEDVHWADLSSIRLLEPLIRLAGHCPVLFIHALRSHPEETAQRVLRAADVACPERSVTLRLERLTDKECDALIENLLPGAAVPWTTRAVLREKAEGNPFFIEEVVRGLIDEGIIEHRDGRFRATDRIATVTIPGTIHDVIMARVDRLDESTRQVLQIASVIGRSFYRHIVTDLLVDHSHLDDELAILIDKQLVFERHTRRTASPRRRLFAEEVEFVFTHALAQEAVYASLLQRTRKELHGKVAQSIERRFADRLVDFYGMLAYHFGRAEVLDKAEEYLFKAGDEAARAAASSEALTYFREASRLYLLANRDGGDPARRALLEKNIGLALVNKGDLIECIPHFDAALAFLGETRPTGTLGQGLRSIADLAAVVFRLYVPRRIQRAPDELARDQEVLAICGHRARAQATSDPRRFFLDSIGGVRRLDQTEATAIDAACSLYAGAAALFAFSGFSFRVSARFLDRAGSLVREGSARDAFVYRSMRFVHDYFQGDWREERAIDDALVEQGLRYGQLWDVSAYLGFRCDIKTHQGDFATVRRLIDELTEIEEVYAYDFARSFVYGYQAMLAVEERRLEAAIDAADAYYRARLEDVLNVLALGVKAKAHVLHGDREASEATLTAAERIIARAGRVPPWHLSEYALARLLYDLAALERGDGGRGAERAAKRRAAASAKRVIRVAGKVAKVRVEAYRLAGRLAWLGGRRRRALAWWDRSIAEGERMGARPELGRTWAEIGSRLAGAPEGGLTVRGRDASACLAEARALFTSLGLTWDLDRLIDPARRAA